MLTEAQFKTSLYCPELYRLDGNILEVSASQNIIYESIKEVYLLFLKKNLFDFNQDLIKIIKTNIANYHPSLSTIDDIQYLVSWAINIINCYFKIFPITIYTPLAINFSPTVSTEFISLKLELDLILVENVNPSKIHTVNFYPMVTKHIKENDFLISIKIQCLKEIYSHISSNIPVKIHYLSVPSATFRNKSQKNYSFSHVSSGRIKKQHKVSFLNAQKKYLESCGSPHTIPYCPNINCTKRKECTYG